MDRSEARRVGKLKLGDKIEKIAETTGIKRAVAVVERATGWKCGCAKRRAWLNRL
jgi:hypothetical protein